MLKPNSATIPKWQGTPEFQEAFAGSFRLTVRKNTENSRFSVFINEKQVTDEAVDLQYARRQALYELEQIIAQAQVDLNLLWDSTS